MTESSWVPLNARIRPVGGKLVRFSLADVVPWVRRLPAPGAGSTSRELDDLAERVRAAHRAAHEIATALEEAWDRLGLCGAVLVYAGDKESGLCASPVRDPLVVVNVLARTRGNLLLPKTPLELDAERLARVLVTDDPRFVALSGKAAAKTSCGGSR